MNISDYIIEFNKLYSVCKVNEMTLPTGVLAIQFLESASLPEAHHKLALATCDKMEFEMMKSQVLKISTNLSVPSTSKILCPVPAAEIKIESTALAAEYYEETPDDEYYGEHQAEEEPNETFYGYRYNNRPQNRPYNNYQSYSNRGFARGRARSYNNYPRHNNAGPRPQTQSKPTKNKQLNAADRFGRPRQCRECLSVYHLEEKCPELENNIVLLTDEVTPTSSLLGETLGCMVVDSGCIHAVCGTAWLESYLDSLSCKDRKSIIVEESTGRFRFGNGSSFKSLKRVTIPIYLGKIRTRISTDVVQCDIPLLFSKNSLKKANGSINFVKDTIILMHQDLKLEATSTGHYFLRLSRSTDGPIEDISDVLFSVNVDGMDTAAMRATATKWHKQFAHPPAHKLLKLLESAGINNPDMKAAIEDISNKCQTCQKFKKTPTKPVVAFPLASRFNETVAIDLKDIRPGTKIINIVDHATRYSQAAIVRNKTAPEIVKKLFDTWIRIFGCPERILADNGGEFHNQEFMDLCDKCNIKILTTAAESPWSNGLVEKHNGILGNMVAKMLEDSPIDIEIAIHWAVAAKNALTTVYGFSPNVLVFGRDPSIPNTMSNNIPANDPQFYSQLVKENITALHRARECFIHQESAEKLSRALNRQTRTYSDKPFVSGDEVYYKREQHSKWQGPAKVLGKDSNQVLIKHGSFYIRVHPCRLLHIQDESEVDEGNRSDQLPEQADSNIGIGHTEDEQYDSDDQSSPTKTNPSYPQNEDCNNQAETDSATQENLNNEVEPSTTELGSSSQNQEHRVIIYHSSWEERTKEE